MLLGIPHHTLISIHALREEGDTAFRLCSHDGQDISIHALREEGDIQLNPIIKSKIISIHALREEGDMFGNMAML